MGNVRRGLLFSFMGKYGLKLIGLFSTVVIARLLTPAELGTFSIASSVVMILTEVKLLGANAYLVRETTLNEQKIRKAYGITLLMCWGIAVGLIVGSPWIAVFFKHEMLQPTFIILALGFFLAPYNSIPDALLVREYKFKEISVIRITATVGQVVSSIALIKLGYSVYALAWGYFINMVIQSIMYLYYTRETRIYLPSFRGISEIAKLGIYTSVSNIVRRIHYTASDIVIGKMGTPTEVGMFSRGMGFIDFISQSILDGIGSVSQPYMSDVKRKGNDIAAAYIKITSMLCSLIWPVLAVAGLASLPAIRLLFGEQWDSAAPIASILAIWMIVKVTNFFSTPLLVAVGAEAMLFKRDLVLFFLLIIMLVLVYPLGLQSLACVFLVNSCVELLITIFLLRKCINLNLKLFSSSLFRPFVVLMVCLTVALLLDLNIDFNHAHPLKVLIVLAITMPVIWLMTAKILRLQIYYEVIDMLKVALRKKDPAHYNE